jgi:chromosome segregation ATPase
MSDPVQDRINEAIAIVEAKYRVQMQEAELRFAKKLEDEMQKRVVEVQNKAFLAEEFMKLKEELSKEKTAFAQACIEHRENREAQVRDHCQEVQNLERALQEKDKVIASLAADLDLARDEIDELKGQLSRTQKSMPPSPTLCFATPRLIQQPQGVMARLTESMSRLQTREDVERQIEEDRLLAFKLSDGNRPTSVRDLAGPAAARRQHEFESRGRPSMDRDIEFSQHRYPSLFGSGLFGSGSSTPNTRDFGC